MSDREEDSSDVDHHQRMDVTGDGPSDIEMEEPKHASETVESLKSVEVADGLVSPAAVDVDCGNMLETIAGIQAQKQKVDEVDRLIALPADIFQEILMKITPRDLLRLSCASKLHLRACSDKDFQDRSVTLDGTPYFLVRSKNLENKGPEPCMYLPFETQTRTFNEKDIVVCPPFPCEHLNMNIFKFQGLFTVTSFEKGSFGDVKQVAVQQLCESGWNLKRHILFSAFSGLVLCGVDDYLVGDTEDFLKFHGVNTGESVFFEKSSLMTVETAVLYEPHMCCFHGCEDLRREQGSASFEV